MEFVTNIKEKEYEEFVSKHDSKSHFLQSYPWGKFAENNKHVKSYYLGVKEKNKLVAASLLLEKKLPLGYNYYYSPRGFVLDYNNKELIKFFTENLKIYLKKKKALFCKIDPDVILHNLTNNNIDNIELINDLKKLGYKHLGFNKNFEMSSPRYTFRLALNKDIDSIVNNFHPTTKKIIKKGNIHNLELIKNDVNRIDEFYKTMSETANREDITIYPMEYYKNLYEELHKNNMSDLYLVKVNINKLKEEYICNINQLNNQIKNLVSETKKQELLNQLNKLEKELEEINKIKEEELTLSSIITVKYGNKVWTLHGGNLNKLRFLNSNYYIYFKIIEDAVNEKYELIDFFGTTGNPDPSNPIYGIHLFKSRLGGEYLEFIGELDLIIKPFMYFIFTKLIPIYRKIIIKKTKKNIKKNS